MKRHAVGVLISDRWSLTEMVLMSLYYSDQSKDDYDLYLIDNASSSNTQHELKEFTKSGILPVKNLFILPVHATISQAWNLFLAMTKDYEYRTKIDNDMIMLGTVTPPSKKAKKGVPETHPAEVDPLMGGAPRSASIVGGVTSIGSRVHTRTVGIHGSGETNKLDSGGKHSRFLDHLEGFAREYNSDLTALVPVPPNGLFPAILEAISRQTIEGRPYLLGAFMMISRRAFEKIGYMDERLPRRETIEYSQRAIKNGLSIGYHDSYWAVHIGQGKDTDPLNKEMQDTFSLRLYQEHPISGIADSVWEKVINRISKSSSKNKIVNLR